MGASFLLIILIHSFLRGACLVLGFIDVRLQPGVDLVLRGKGLLLLGGLVALARQREREPLLLGLQRRDAREGFDFVLLEGVGAGAQVFGQLRQVGVRRLLRDPHFRGRGHGPRHALYVPAGPVRVLRCWGAGVLSD